MRRGWSVEGVVVRDRDLGVACLARIGEVRLAAMNVVLIFGVSTVLFATQPADAVYDGLLHFE